METEHKCWIIEKGKDPNPNQYRLKCIEILPKKWYQKQKYLFHWQCWDCYKEVKVIYHGKETFKKDNINIC